MNQITSTEIVSFWRAAGPRRWFEKDDDFDRTIRWRFLATHEAAARDELAAFEESPEGALALVVLRSRTDYAAIQVSFVGKAATLCLMYAFPLLFLGAHGGNVSEVVRIIGWAFAVWGIALYWWAALLYLTQIRDLVKEAHPT